MIVCGIDEVGRGPLAGPVCAAALVFLSPPDPDTLADSKKLSHARRLSAANSIRKTALCALGWASSTEIDRINILQATMRAMERAFQNLNRLCEHRGVIIDRVLVDGNRCPNLSPPCTAVVRGDDHVPQIQAASIMAKLARDLWMESYSRVESRYGFSEHKGYPTKEHRRLIAAYGPCAIHRRSFRGVATEQT